MAKFISGFFVGSVAALVALSLFAGLLCFQSERQLIDQWRKIEPGMERHAVIELLGEPSYDIKLGEDFPGWAEMSIPDDYYQTHGLLVFAVPVPGPQLLLVYFDEDGRVSFVSSTYT
ncbi:MAG: hypothetical protein R3E01_22525 [Pirellulaceae bacterium]|nr:hypothetical protein [Planctomycetales bacterium]